MAFDFNTVLFFYYLFVLSISTNIIHLKILQNKFIFQFFIYFQLFINT